MGDRGHDEGHAGGHDVDDERHAELTRRLRAAGSVFAEDEATLLLEVPRPADGLEALVRRRVAGEPLEHVLGEVRFAGLRLAVGPGVFVPRRRTELLARLAVEHATRRPGAVVVELCCGCAPVAAAVAAAVPGTRVHATDVDPHAVVHAWTNLAGRGQVHLGDLDAPLPHDLRGRVDVLVADAPYVPSAAVATMPREARTYEPLRALDGGADGLDILRRVLAAAPRWLTADGVVVVEAAADQVGRLVEAASRHGLVAGPVLDPDLDATAVVARRHRPADDEGPAP